MAKRTRERTREKKRKQQQQILIGVGVVMVIVAVIAVAAYLAGREADFPENVAAAYEGIEQGFTEEGFPRLGSADAPVVAEEYSSFGCPSCKNLHEDQLSTLKDDLRAGNVQVIFKPITFIANNDNNDAGKSARAAICAAQQGHFWEMHDILFSWQGSYSVNDTRLEAAADELGIDKEALMECYNSNQADAVIARAEQEFRAGGYSGTPAVLVNGQSTGTNLRGAVQSELQRLGLGG